MADDLHDLGEDLIATTARVVRWAPSEGSRISVASARVMARLQDAGQLKISDLAHAERSSQPTITNHVKRLEAMGLVQRHSDPRDGRVSLISLTDAGRQELRALRDLIGTALSPRLAELSEEEREALRRGLEVMRHLLGR
ncbi:DNA-binding MarR family transcriptional regulator [Friedmanniella endophytica]|uniref:DNA-binding MarR family transcriptional regulator n=1 Tax=Microlunatus kandeliicorticis TaxID=1759536 RepID=A0A7W3P6A2_9ACTN|nr:MarR family transcriptional regulator [Microlunatus kandeliicorticis]MBA8794836.1 DNA-binding MarR family transcriptional regulator [Microlunatus kandeliicorticis]